MAIPFVAVPKINPRNKTAPPVYYAAVKTSGMITPEELAKDIKNMSTASIADVRLVLEAVEDTVLSHLSQGKIVDLGFVKLYPAVYSDGYGSSEEITVRAIKKVSVLAQVGKRLKEKIRFEEVIKHR